MGIYERKYSQSKENVQIGWYFKIHRQHFELSSEGKHGDGNSEISSENYASLIMPNGTFILKEIAEKLAADVMDYNPKKNKMTEDTGEISPTRVLEAMYNIYKH